MPHSNQIREFTLSEKGSVLRTCTSAKAGFSPGSARQSQEAKDRAEATARQQELERKRRDLERRVKAAESQAEALRMQMEQDRLELEMMQEQEKKRDEAQVLDRRRQSEIRKADQAEQGTGKNLRHMKKAS